MNKVIPLSGSAPFPEGAPIEVEEAALSRATMRMEGQALYYGAEIDRQTIKFRVLSRQNAPGQKLLIVSATAAIPEPADG